MCWIKIILADFYDECVTSFRCKLFPDGNRLTRLGHSKLVLDDGGMWF